MNRRPPSKLGKLKTNADKLFGKIPSGLKKGAGIAASVGGLTGLMKGGKGLSGLGDAMKNIGKGSGKLLKKVPILGGLLSATNLIGMKKRMLVKRSVRLEAVSPAGWQVLQQVQLLEA